MYAGKKLRLLRQHLDLNQDDFATELKISRPYYSAIERGKKKLTNKLLEIIRQKWLINEDYFDANSSKSVNEYLGSKSGGINGGDSENDATEQKAYIEVIKNKIIKDFPKMEFVYKSTEDLKNSHPDLSEIQYEISDFAALILDASNIYEEYLQDALFPRINAKNYDEYQNLLIKHLVKFSKYQPLIKPLIKTLREFILEFKKYDTGDVIEHENDELQ